MNEAYRCRCGVFVPSGQAHYCQPEQPIIPAVEDDLEPQMVEAWGAFRLALSRYGLVIIRAGAIKEMQRDLRARIERLRETLGQIASVAERNWSADHALEHIAIIAREALQDGD